MEICKICDTECKSRSALTAHLRHTHSVPSYIYQYKYEGTFNKCETCHIELSLEHVKSLWRPGVKIMHCSDKCSKLGKTRPPKFYVLNEGISLKEAEKRAFSVKSKNTKGKTPFSLKYWLDKGFSSNDAKVKLAEVQNRTSLESFIVRYGKMERY